ncbi:DUF547 domain-containing protein [Planctomycetota bacterium]|nr:DUF547 domain-containing protein [Planctomycetota bacterium]
MSRFLLVSLMLLVVPLGACTSDDDPPAPSANAQSAPVQSNNAPAGDALHEPFTELLARYVSDQNRVDYAGWKANDEDALLAYVNSLATVDPEALPSQQERMAYWINAYNAVTIQAMLEFWPLDSIKDKVSRLPGAYNVWDDYLFGPRQVSLNVMEHEKLRPMGDPRIHAGIVCASGGCPPLRAEAYLPTRLDDQLTDNVRVWLADTGRGVKLQGDEVYVSQIFDWFGDDFGADEQERMTWIADYVDDALAARLRSGELDVEYLDYDWQLNKQ